MANFLDYIGTAGEYPIKVASGALRIITGIDVIRASIEQILLIPVGKLPANPYFGSNLFRLLHNPLDAVVISAGRTYIKEAIKRWERRVEVSRIDAVARVRRTVNGDGSIKLDNVVEFSITYRLIATNQTDTFVFPFYRELKF